MQLKHLGPYELLLRDADKARKARLNGPKPARKLVIVKPLAPPAPVKEEVVSIQDMKAVRLEALKLEMKLLARRVEAELRHGGQGDIPSPAHPLKRIAGTVAQFYNVSLSDLFSTRRCKHFVRARHVAMYLAKELTRKSLPEIARRFGGRDHTTILHACTSIARKRPSDPDLDDDLIKLTAMLTLPAREGSHV
jgi:hypothetical protein